VCSWVGILIDFGLVSQVLIDLIPCWTVWD
jgi:hypothetical protein